MIRHLLVQALYCAFLPLPRTSVLMFYQGVGFATMLVESNNSTTTIYVYAILLPLLYIYCSLHML